VVWTLETIPTELKKYWYQRYSLFSKFDQQIHMDYDGWFSVTPETIAKHLANRMACHTIVDAFCGVGGNTIQFAQTCDHVIAIDINPIRLECARHNARIYGVEDKIQFILGDFMEIGPTLHADGVFLSPPWGGPEYLQVEEFDINTMMPINGTELYRVANQISNSICYFLPKNINHHQVIRLAGSGGECEMEQTFLNDRLKCWNIYYGSLVQKSNTLME
ncbi:RNA cap guanine-N2 methyltransferase-domain-containing protein, partial [Globomyces pollinis-pini]